MPETSTIGQRITQLIQHLGITKNAFAQSLGKTATVIQHLVDERNKPGYDLLCKIVDIYPNVSLQWLMLGEPPMLSQVDTRPRSAPDSVVASASTGIDLNEVPDVPRRRHGALLQPADIAATLALASPPRNGSNSSNGHPAPAAAKQPPGVEAPKPTAPASLGEAAPVAPEAAPVPVAAPAVAPTAPPLPAAASAWSTPAPPDPAYLASLFQTQQLQHQLALAEQRNQHLLEQQALLQQMVQLLQRAV